MNAAVEVPPASPAHSSQAWTILHAVLFVATLPAALVPFLPFARDVSPLKAVGIGLKSLDEIIFFMIGAPAFLGLPIVLGQLRRLGGRSLTRFERVIGFALAGVSSTLSLAPLTGLLLNADGAWKIFPGSLLIFAAGPAVLLWRRRRTTPIDLLPLAALRIAYLANAGLCLVIFAAFREPLGWSLTLIASVAMATDVLTTILRRPPPAVLDGGHSAATTGPG